MELYDLYTKIIPPADYIHREGFSNKKIIDTLDNDIRSKVEDELISRLMESREFPDELIIDTLVYMKSMKLEPILYHLLKETKEPSYRMMYSSALYQLNFDKKMFDVISNSIKKITNPLSLAYVLHYLKPFHITEAKSLIMNYLNHENYLVRVNAKKIYEVL